MIPVLTRPAPRSRPRAVPPFSPADVAGLTVWLKDGGAYQDAGLSIAAAADGEAVHTWADASGAGHHLVQATAANRPTTRTNQRAGRPAIRFDGINDWMERVFTLNQPITCVCVLRFPTHNRLFMDGSSPGAKGQIGQTTLNQASLYAGAFLNSGAGFGGGVWVMISWVLNGSGSEIYLNGTLSATGNAGASAPGGVTLGSYGDHTSNFHNGEIGELVIYAGVLSTPDRQLVEGYLAGKWMTAKEPIEVAGCGGWWRGDEGSFYQDSGGSVPAAADGDPVGLWANKMPAPAAAHMTQAQAAAPDRRPQLKLNLVNGQHALRFDGTDDWLTGGSLGSMITAAAGVVYVVFRATGFNQMNPGAETGSALASDGLWCDTTARSGVSLTGATPKIHAWNSETGAEVDTDLARLPLAAGTWYAHAWRHAGGTLTARLGSGTPPAAEASVASGNWASTGNFRLGANYDGTFPAHVDVAEVFFFNVDPPPADLAAVETYLRLRYLA